MKDIGIRRSRTSTSIRQKKRSSYIVSEDRHERCIFLQFPFHFQEGGNMGMRLGQLLLSYPPHGLKRTQTVEKVGGYWPTFQCRSRLRQILDWSRHTCWDGRWGTQQSCQLGDHPLSQTLQCSLSTREHIVNKTLQQCTYLHYHHRGYCEQLSMEFSHGKNS